MTSAGAPDSIERALWFHTAPPPPDTTKLRGTLDCEVAIIGAGILGLSAARVLAEAGRSVVVLDADAIGHGASGRNGGLVVPSLPRVGPADLVAALGPEQGERLLRLVAGGADHVFALIRALGIDCDARQTGWLNPAHAAMLLSGLRARVSAWQDAGAAAVLLDAAETRARMGSPHFHGALFDRTGGHLNPLAYARGLARAALAAGAAIHTGSAVVAVAPGWILRTADGTVRARKILQCTNLTMPLLPSASPGGAAVRDSLVPLMVYQMATEKLPASVRAAVLPGDEAFSDTRNNLLACRWTAQGQLVTGGMASLHAGAMERVPARAARRLAAVFPALAGVSLPHVWRGRAALTGDFLPRLFGVAEGWLAPIGCNGRGIVLCTGLGEAIGRYLATGDAASLPLPMVVPHPRRFARLLPLVPQALLPLGDWQDRRRAAAN